MTDYFVFNVNCVDFNNRYCGLMTSQYQKEKIICFLQNINFFHVHWYWLQNKTIYFCWRTYIYFSYILQIY